MCASSSVMVYLILTITNYAIVEPVLIGEKTFQYFQHSLFFLNCFLSMISISLILNFNRKKELVLNNMIVQKDILLKEVQHRVKNNLQIISSMTRLKRLMMMKVRKTLLISFKSEFHQSRKYMICFIKVMTINMLILKTILVICSSNLKTRLY